MICDITIIKQRYYEALIYPFVYLFFFQIHQKLITINLLLGHYEMPRATIINSFLQNLRNEYMPSTKSSMLSTEQSLKMQKFYRTCTVKFNLLPYNLV